MKSLKSRDGYAIATFIWLLACLLGTIPYLVSGTLDNFIDALFESCSGFSTTGATVIDDLSVVSKPILFFRCFSQWLGGLGIVVLITALIPSWGINGQITAYAETPGSQKGKNTAKFSETATYLYLIYIAFTILQTILLVISGMSFFDALTTSFSTMATGGFSNYNSSAADFGIFSQIIIALFMLFAGINFSLYYKFIKRKTVKVFRDDEVIFYFMIILLATVFTLVSLITLGKHSFSLQTVVDSFFQVVSIITTTGLTTHDYTLWPTICCMILFVLFFIGGCSGSTSGGMKVSRLLICIKLMKRTFNLRVHPNRVSKISINRKELPTDVIIRTTGFVLMYILTILIGTLLISIDNISFMSSLSASLSCLGNIGPGFDMIGPSFTYSSLSCFSKLVCSFLMVLGRLELYTIYVLFSRYYWNYNRS